MDMLVRLYSMPAARPVPEGFNIRRAMACERLPVSDWVRSRFGDGWAGECEAAFGRLPVSCFISTREGALCGFACYDATCRNFFGPTGVEEPMRGIGIGRSLLAACLRAMEAEGYAYAIIGGVGEGSRAFYEECAGAVLIEGSEPGIYVDRLGPNRGPAAGRPGGVQ